MVRDRRRAMKQHKRGPLTSEQVDNLSNACVSHHERVVVYVLLDCGLRVAELEGLTKPLISWQQRTLTIYGKGGDDGAMSKPRVIPMTTRVAELLNRHFAITDGPGLGAGYSRRQIQRVVAMVADRAGISRKVHPHMLRHTFAVTCLRKGMSTRTVQELLGHDRLQTTELYLKWSPEDVLRDFRDKW
jgi:integrase/recombinase XerD